MILRTIKHAWLYVRDMWRLCRAIANGDMFEDRGMKVSFKFWLFSTIVGAVVVLPVFMTITFANAILRCFPCVAEGCEDIQHNNNTLDRQSARIINHSGRIAKGGKN